VRHKHSGHSRHDAEDDLELRSPTSVNGHDPNSGDVKETRGNVERTRIDNDDKGDVVVWEVEQEDEELNLIEESRRRTQAIMEKYKKKLEQQNGFSSHDLELANIPKQSSTVADVLGSGTLGPVTSAVNQAKAGLDIDAVDGEVAKLSSAVGESPAQLVISDSDRTLASTGLGEGSPKDKISDDMFTDDIFGESPADSQKMVCTLTQIIDLVFIEFSNSGFICFVFPVHHLTRYSRNGLPFVHYIFVVSFFSSFVS
jgi:serine/threonine-protein kinase PRP4